jgi:hypothetical protein
MFDVVDRVANYSGLSYSLERGADITVESETVWAEILKVSAANSPLPPAATNTIQHTPSAKHFKNKGWPHYEALKELLPSKTRGNLAFYTRMPADNVALVGAPSQATASQPPAGISFGEANIFDQEKALDNIEYGADNPPDVDITMLPPSTIPQAVDAAQRPTFTPSTPGTSTIASGKRKAGGGPDDSMRTLARPPGSTKSATESGKSVKSQHVAIPQAFQDMGKEIHNLSNSFDRATDVMQEHATQVASRPMVDPIPVRKHKAISQLQKEGLEDREVVEVIKHFQADVAIADSYLAIEKESIRKLFLSTYLK